MPLKKSITDSGKDNMPADLKKIGSGGTSNTP